MDFNSTRRLRVIILLLISPISVLLEGMNHKLHCVNDYISIINCSLETSLPSDFSAVWLKLTSSYQGETSQCWLSRFNEHYYCSVEVDSGFVDLEVYKISLCQKQNETESCELLENNYRPSQTIKPKAPSGLTLSQNSSQYHFSWKSTYEPYTDYTELVQYLKYQLRIYKRGHKHDGTSRNININTTFTLEDDTLIPDSEYAAKVRSSPNNAFYKGHWSAWSSEVQWRTNPAVDETSASVFKLQKVLLPMCVMVPLILVFCFVSIKKWKQDVFIPTPEPYFQTLYSDYHGNFKSWVIMKEKTMDIPKTENTLQIDKLSKCADIHEVDSCVTESSGYINEREPGDVVAQQGISSTASTSGLLSAAGSCVSTDLFVQSGSPTEGDSGCWLSSDLSLGKGHPWYFNDYCNDYCTLSSFQQSALGTAHHGSEALKYGTNIIIKENVIEGAPSVCG